MRQIAAPLTLFVLLSGVTAPAQARPPVVPVVLHVYGPGGPGPAMREAGKVFGDKKGIKIEFTCGPVPGWKEQAPRDADLLFSGAEYMMTDYVQNDFPGLIEVSTIRTLYLRPSVILVRPGNPKGVKGVRDLARPGIKLMVVQGTGQVGMWEDVAGRTGDVKLVDGIRRNIATSASSSAEAKKMWSGDPSFDAWLIWRIWQKESPASADLVNTEPEFTIYRSCGIAITSRSPQKALAREFEDFLQSDKGREIFAKWGWDVPQARQ